MSDVPIQPLQDYVLIEPVMGEEKTAAGIYIPDTAKEKPQEGIVVEKAPDATDDVAIGDRVIYQRHSGHEVKLGSKTYRLVPSGDLLAKYVDADEIPE